MFSGRRVAARRAALGALKLLTDDASGARACFAFDHPFMFMECVPLPKSSSSLDDLTGHIPCATATAWPSCTSTHPELRLDDLAPEQAIESRQVRTRPRSACVSVNRGWRCLLALALPETSGLLSAAMSGSSYFCSPTQQTRSHRRNSIEV